MSMPSREDYVAAVQKPRNFGLPILVNCHVGRDSATEAPQAWPGAFGVVFRMVSPNGSSRAIKCFTVPHQTRAARYSAIADYLDHLLNVEADSARYLTQCYYASKGIYAASRWQPLLMMQWVDGEPLNEYVGRVCAEPDPGPRLLALAQHWINLVLALRKDRIAHGDLQHGNVFVTPGGGLKLIDYDGMCVPSLTGRFVVEGGHPNYQHPRRSVYFNERLDDFSALVILAALIILVTHPGLWPKYDQGRNMLFQERDFHDPKASPLFADLEKSPDATVAYVTEMMKLAASVQSFDDVPVFEDVATNLAKA